MKRFELRINNYGRNNSTKIAEVCFHFIINDKSVEGVLGNQTRGGRMVVADESTELWRQPLLSKFTKYCLLHSGKGNLCLEHLTLTIHFR